MHDRNLKLSGLNDPQSNKDDVSLASSMFHLQGQGHSGLKFCVAVVKAMIYMLYSHNVCHTTLIFNSTCMRINLCLKCKMMSYNSNIWPRNMAFAFPDCTD